MLNLKDEYQNIFNSTFQISTCMSTNITPDNLRKLQLLARKMDTPPIKKVIEKLNFRNQAITYVITETTFKLVNNLYILCDEITDDNSELLYAYLNLQFNRNAQFTTLHGRYLQEKLNDAKSRTILRCINVQPLVSIYEIKCILDLDYSVLYKHLCKQLMKKIGIEHSLFDNINFPRGTYIRFIVNYHDLDSKSLLKFVNENNYVSLLLNITNLNNFIQTKDSYEFSSVLSHVITNTPEDSVFKKVNYYPNHDLFVEIVKRNTNEAMKLLQLADTYHITHLLVNFDIWIKIPNSIKEILLTNRNSKVISLCADYSLLAKHIINLMVRPNPDLLQHCSPDSTRKIIDIPLHHLCLAHLIGIQKLYNYVTTCMKSPKTKLLDIKYKSPNDLVFTTIAFLYINVPEIRAKLNYLISNGIGFDLEVLTNNYANFDKSNLLYQLLKIAN